MRRADREVKSIDRIEDILSSSDILRVGYKDGDSIYIVPVNFAYEISCDGELRLFFHGAMAGRKWELSHLSPTVGFELDCSYRPIRGIRACDFSASYRSVIGEGRVRVIENEGEKRRALSLLLRRLDAGDDFSFDEVVLKRTAVYMIEASSWSAKEHIA